MSWFRVCFRFSGNKHRESWENVAFIEWGIPPTGEKEFYWIHTQKERLRNRKEYVPGSSNPMKALGDLNYNCKGQLTRALSVTSADVPMNSWARYASSGHFFLRGSGGSPPPVSWNSPKGRKIQLVKWVYTDQGHKKRFIFFNLDMLIFKFHNGQGHQLNSSEDDLIISEFQGTPISMLNRSSHWK